MTLFCEGCGVVGNALPQFCIGLFNLRLVKKYILIIQSVLSSVILINFALACLICGVLTNWRKFGELAWF